MEAGAVRRGAPFNVTAPAPATAEPRVTAVRTGFIVGQRSHDGCTLSLCSVFFFYLRFCVALNFYVIVGLLKT